MIGCRSGISPCAAEPPEAAATKNSRIIKPRLSAMEARITEALLASLMGGRKSQSQSPPPVRFVSVEGVEVAGAGCIDVDPSGTTRGTLRGEKNDTKAPPGDHGVLAAYSDKDCKGAPYSSATLPPQFHFAAPSLFDDLDIDLSGEVETTKDALYVTGGGDVGMGAIPLPMACPSKCYTVEGYTDDPRVVPSAQRVGAVAAKCSVDEKGLGILTGWEATGTQKPQCQGPPGPTAQVGAKVVTRGPDEFYNFVYAVKGGWKPPASPAPPREGGGGGHHWIVAACVGSALLLLLLFVVYFGRRRG
jgi:hypothetical protein